MKQLCNYSNRTYTNLCISIIICISVITYRRLKELIVECDIDTTMTLNIDPKAKEVRAVWCVMLDMYAWADLGPIEREATGEQTLLKL